MGRDQKRRIIKFTFILKHNNVNCDWGEERGKFHSAILSENHLSLMALCIFIYGKFEKKLNHFIMVPLLMASFSLVASYQP